MIIDTIRELVDNGKYDEAQLLLKDLYGVDKIEGLLLESWIWESKGQYDKALDKAKGVLKQSQNF